MKPSHFIQSAKTRALLSLGKKTPLRVTQAITFRCNLRCSFCDVPERKVKEFSTEEVKEAMQSFKAMGCIGWGFTGGEPLLREDIVELFQFAKQCDFTTSLVTNGTLTQQVSKLEKGFLDFVMVSLDGTKEEMERIRGKGTYDKVLTSIDILRKKGLNVALSTTIDGYSQDVIDHILGLGKKLGVYCSFQPVFDWSTGREMPDLLASAERLNRLKKNIEYLIEQKNQGAPVWNSLGYLRYVKNYGQIKNERCFAGSLYLMMDPQGILHNCWWLGNKIYYKDYAKAFRQLPEPPKGCYCFPWCHKEYSEVFSFNPRAILNTLKKL